jgi:hypothetical protein
MQSCQRKCRHLLEFIVSIAMLRTTHDCQFAAREAEINKIILDADFSMFHRKG